MDREKLEGENRKLHILQVHDYYKISGGEDRVVENERELLREHGHKVWLYARRNGELAKMTPWEKLCLPFTTVFSLKTYREVKRLIREKKIDVVHVHNTLPLISPSVFYAAFAAGVPAVMSVHNFRLLCPGALFFRNGKVCEECVERGLHRSVRYGCYRGSRAQTLLCAVSMKLHRIAGTYRRIYYICLTDFNREKLLKLKGIRPDRVFVKPNFAEVGENNREEKREKGRIEIEKEEEREEEKRERGGEEGREREERERGEEGRECEEREREGEWKDYFLYGGRLEEEKGVKVLLRAFRRLKDETLVICGEGSLAGWCQEYVKKHAMENVVLKGAVSGGELKALMGRAKGVIVPSLWYEGFPMVIAEAYSVKTPVIGSDAGNVGRLVGEYGGRTFETGNVKALAEAVESCGKEQEISAAGKERAGTGIKEWSGEGNYRKLMQIYGRCMADVWKTKEK